MNRFLQHCFLQHCLHLGLRPIAVGVMLFVLFNLVVTLGVTCSPLNQKFNFSYGNYLPAKLNMMQAQQPARFDVLFLGTSQTNNGFIPGVFEKASGRPLRAFNLGLPNNRYDIMQSVLQAHVRRYGKPRLVLLELGPSIQEKDAYFYYLPALYYRSLIERSLLACDPAMAVQWLGNPLLADNVKKELFLSSLSSLHQYRFTFSPVNMLGKAGQLLGHLKEDVRSRMMLSALSASAQAADKVAEVPDLSSSKRVDMLSTTKKTLTITEDMTATGWFPKEQSPNMTTPEGVRQSVAEARAYYIDQQKGVHFDKLRRLLAYCRQEGIPVVLVSWPNHPAFNRLLRQSSIGQQYDRGLKALLQEYPTPRIDLNQAIPAHFQESEGGLFSDPRHLTPEGAHFFSQRLAQALQALD